MVAIEVEVLLEEVMRFFIMAVRVVDVGGGGGGGGCGGGGGGGGC